MSKFDNMGIGGLVNYLANILSQPVQDKTGLTGRYTFSLELRPPEAVPGQLPQAVDVPGIVFSAVQEQLGLKLQPQRVSTEVLLIEHAEHPTGN